MAKKIRTALPFEAPDVVHHLPHFGRSDTRTPIETLHCAGTADPIANADEDFAICGTVVPSVVNEVGRANLIAGHCGGDFTHAVAIHAMTLGAEPVVELLTGREMLLGRL